MQQAVKTPTVVVFVIRTEFRLSELNPEMEFRIFCCCAEQGIKLQAVQWGFSFTSSKEHFEEGNIYLVCQESMNLKVISTILHN